MLTMMSPAETELRRAIREILGRGIPTTVWEYFRTLGRVTDVLRNDYSKEDLASDMRAVVSYADFARNRPRGLRILPETDSGQEVVRREVSAYPELDAVCEIMGLEASGNPEVIGFREDILGGCPIPPSAVEDWVEEASAKCIGRPLLLQTEEDQAALLDQVLRWRGSRPVPCVLPDWPGRSELPPEDKLEYPIPGRTGSPLDFRERLVSVPARGPLWLLKFVAVGLMGEYPWSEAQAVGFILSGVVPRIPTASISQYRLFPFRIVLDLDPGLTAKTVASEYRRAQKDLLNVRKRAKSQSEKHLRLAVFMAKNTDGTWENHMEAWNCDVRPEWAYSDSRQFQRDASHARDVLKQRRARGRMRSTFRRTENTYGLR